MKKTKYMYTFPGVTLREERLVYEGGAEGPKAAPETGKAEAAKTETPEAKVARQAKEKADTEAAKIFEQALAAGKPPAMTPEQAAANAKSDAETRAALKDPSALPHLIPEQRIVSTQPRVIQVPEQRIVSTESTPTKPAEAQKPTAAQKPAEAEQKPKPTGSVEIGTVETRERPAPTLTATEKADILAAVNSNPTFGNFVPGPGKGMAQVDVNVPDKGKWTVTKSLLGVDMRFKSW